jgi:hypothetical protein
MWNRRNAYRGLVGNLKVGGHLEETRRRWMDSIKMEH